MGGLLVCSIAFNCYQAINCEQNEAICAVNGSYDTAITIPRDQAMEKYLEFKETLVSPDDITGGVIAKETFEKIFCLENCNGLTYSFARDASGTVGPRNKGIFLIVEGVNITFDSDGEMVVTAIPGSQKYRSGSWCPPSCMK